MTLEELRVLTPYVLLAVAGLGSMVAGLVIYLLKRAYESIKDDIKQIGQKLESHTSELEDQIGRVEKDFLNFKVELPQIYVLRSDHFRNMSILENKIDEHGRDIKAMVQKLGSNEATLQKLCGQLEARDDH